MVKGVKSVRGRRQQPKAKAKAAAEPAEPRQGMLLRFDGSGYLQVLDDQAPGFAPSAGALPILAAVQQLLAKKALEEMPPDSSSPSESGEENGQADPGAASSNDLIRELLFLEQDTTVTGEAGEQDEKKDKDKTAEDPKK